MRQKMLKLFSIVLAIILCICCLSACGNDNNNNNGGNTINESYYVDEETGEIIDATTGKTIDDKNLIVDETTGNIIDKETGETVQTKEESDKVKEEVTSKPNNEESKPQESQKPTDNKNQNVENKNPETTKRNDYKNEQGGNSGNTTTTQPTNPTEPPAQVCQHTETKVVGKKNATCINKGYTGDVQCKRCNSLISKGSDIQATGHKNTEVRNQKNATETSAGYTGDVYCKDCGTKISSGNTIPKLENNNGKVEYILPDGTSVWLEPGTDITGYYMAQKTKTAQHFYFEVEKEILRLCNIEREKEGLQPLVWFEDAYYFTQIRANESAVEFSHTRPNGKKWQTAYTDAGVYLVGYNGENLFDSVGYSAKEFAACAVEWWMKSPGHKANILNPKFNRIAIAIVQNGNQLTAVQNFFS